MKKKLAFSILPALTLNNDNYKYTQGDAMSENKEETTNQTQVPENQEDQQPGLSVNDLAAMKSIIDTASQRGAFKPSEMVVVGQTYTRLVEFLDAIAKQSQATNQQG